MVGAHGTGAPALHASVATLHVFRCNQCSHASLVVPWPLNLDLKNNCLCACRHQLFVDMVRKHAAQPSKQPPNPFANLGRLPNVPLDMPVYGKEFMKAEVL